MTLIISDCSYQRLQVSLKNDTPEAVSQRGQTDRPPGGAGTLPHSAVGTFLGKIFQSFPMLGEDWTRRRAQVLCSCLHYTFSGLSLGNPLPCVQTLEVSFQCTLIDTNPRTSIF